MSVFRVKIKMLEGSHCGVWTLLETQGFIQRLLHPSSPLVWGFAGSVGRGDDRTCLYF